MIICFATKIAITKCCEYFQEYNSWFIENNINNKKLLYRKVYVAVSETNTSWELVLSYIKLLNVSIKVWFCEFISKTFCWIVHGNWIVCLKFCSIVCCFNLQVISTASSQDEHMFLEKINPPLGKAWSFDFFQGFFIIHPKLHIHCCLTV